MKIGLTSISDENLDKIFGNYDKNQKNALDLKDFILYLYPTQQTTEQPDEVAEHQSQTPSNQKNEKKSSLRQKDNNG